MTSCGDTPADESGTSPATRCDPCTAATDCGSALCAVLGTTAFCLAPCDGGCASGYECASETLLSGGAAEVCVPTGGACACSDAAITSGAAGACFNGACEGTATCSADGLGPGLEHSWQHGDLDGRPYQQVKRLAPSSTVLLVTAALLLACHPRGTSGVKAPDERTDRVSQLPFCSSGVDMARLDGQRVRVRGVYRRHLVARKQGEEPTLFLGQVQLELAGRATDYHPSTWDGALALVSLGHEPRPADEVTRFADQTVTVEGRLVLHPPLADPEAAQADPAPTLVVLGTVTAAD